MKFLGQAKKFLQDLGSEPPAKVQYFNVSCASGHRVRGERTEGYQAIRCPACGDGVFVLPRSPLPEPAAPPRPAGSKRETAWAGDRFVEEGPVELTDLPQSEVDLADRRPAQGEVEIIWDDEPASPPPRRNSLTSPADVPDDDAPQADRRTAPDGEPRHAEARTSDPAEGPRRTRAKPSDRPTPTAPGSRPEPTGPSADAPNGQGDRRPAPAAARRPRSRPTPPVIPELRVAPRRRNRLGLIFLLLPLLIIATVGWRLWTQRRQDYPLIANKGRLEGIPALDAGEFEQAYQLLSAARTAVDALGGAVEGADEIRDAAKEAEIFVNLCNDSIEDMLAEAARTPLNVWAAKFDSIYKGRSYIFDTTITAVPPQGSTEGYEVEYLVLPPGVSSRFGDGTAAARPDAFARIDLTGFELFRQGPSKGDPVTFGCRLASLGFDLDKKEWVVHLIPDSGVFMKHRRALEACGPAHQLIDVPQEEGQR